jgi:hypothetical protein
MVVHGPAIFDTGEAAWLMERIRPLRTIVAGVMARTAAEESGLPVAFDGSPPSRIIRALPGPVFLANRGKTPASGRIFGEIVSSRLGERGLVQVECSDASILVWGSGDRGLAGRLAEMTGYRVVSCTPSVTAESGVRTIRGCIPGEPVYVNGIIIGHATEETVVLRQTPSGVSAISGLLIKLHGLEKLAGRSPPDLTTAWCKSGLIRSVSPSPAKRKATFGRIVVIDHCGHELYNRIGTDCCGVLAIGDDTTAVCGHICAHRGIPVLGIIDGDRDEIVPESFSAGSVVLFVCDGRDDDLGVEVARLIPEGPVDWGRWVCTVLSAFENRVRLAADLREDAHDSVR